MTYKWRSVKQKGCYSCGGILDLDQQGPHLAGSTSVRHEVCRPNQPADGCGVVVFDLPSELVIVTTATNQRPEPFDGLRVVDRLVGVKQDVQQLVQVLGVAGP